MKDQKKIRLGLIGVGNWALFAHFRVLRLLPEYEIVAIYSQRKEAAMAVATEYGIPHVAESLDALVTDPLVDQVLVLTTSQQHEEGIRAAITAGKDVYCEWPLTPTAAKSAELATIADAAGVKTQIGLQRQFAPAFRYVRDLVAQGYVGKVRSARMHVSVNMFGKIRANAVRWSLPIENFMSVVAIFGGHFFPVLFSVVGKPSSFSALTANQFPEVTIKETGEKIQTTSPDELLMHGTLADGGLFSIHIEGGKLSGSGVQIDITGDAGDLKITNTSAFGGVDEDFIVTGAKGDSRPLENLPIPAEYEWFPRAGLETGVAELGDLYVALSRDLASGTQAVPTFHDAVWQQQLFEQIQDSSETGKRINLSDQSSNRPLTSKAVTYKALGGPEVIQFVKRTVREPAAGEVRIEVKAAAVNPIDILFRDPGFANLTTNIVPGMDAAGVVESIGPGVSRLHPGQKVIAAVNPVRPEGGAQAQHIVVPSASVVPIPEGVSLAQASILLMTGLTALNALEIAALKKGQILAVSGGAGLLSQYAIAAAKRQGIKVIADANPADADLVRSYGADIVVERGPGFAEAIRRELPNGVDALLDTAALGENSFGAIRDGGIYIPVRGWGDKPAERGIKIKPMTVSGVLERTEWLELLRNMAAAGEIKLRVVEEYAPTKAADAQRALVAGSPRGRPVILF